MIKRLLWVAYRIIVTLVALTTCFIAAFYSTSLIYGKTGIHLSVLMAQIINFLIALFLAVLITYLIRSKLSARHTNLYDSVVEAMEQIARGDFDVHINNDADHSGVFGDLAERVNKMAGELNQVEKMRQEFIANVSHEIQSPLTSIRGFAQALRDNRLNAGERMHYLSIIETESLRLSKLSDNLLRLASLEAQNIKFEPRPYRLDKQLKSLVLASEPQWLGKQLDMQIFLDETEITGDQELLSQVWINLIHNAVKFTPEGGTVRLDLHRSDGRVEVKICDSGIGIAEEDQLHIFERFYKADPSRERSRGGSGLGLAISKKIVEMHQGTITVQSRLDEGAAFTVSLPAT